MRTFELPTSPVATAALEIARTNEDPSLVNHSLRSYWHARRIAEREGVMARLSGDLLFAATVMHELGAGAMAPGRERFEIEGADLAAKALLELGVDESDAEQVWDAIALHTSGGLAERRGLLPRVVRAGILSDFSRAADEARDYQDALHARWPRRNIEKVLADSIIEHVSEPAAAPRYGLTGVLIHERTYHGLTSMEEAAQQFEW